MRRIACAASTFGLIIGGVVLHLAGCLVSTPIDCEHALVNCGSDDGGVLAACIPSNNDRAVDDTCGLFVSSSQGQDGNTGTKSAPLKSLQQAIDKAKGRSVYACAEEFGGSVTLSSGSAIYGGLDCVGGWIYVGAEKRSVLTGDANRPALTITKEASGAVVADFAIQGASATVEGRSSIAVIADQVMASLLRCELAAGDGKPGAAGTQVADDAGLDGVPGIAGVSACAPGTSHMGGAGPMKMCPSGDMSVAGSGGDGGLLSGTTPLPAGNGTDGSPADLSQPTAGKGGLGEGQPGALACSGGAAGVSGAPGESGAGAAGTGSLTESGYSGVKGSDGTAGKTGQGGGGGGGAKGGTTNCSGSSLPVFGASGGSGGTGGCGGAPGGGGGPGGASIALVSHKATMTLTNVTLRAGKGGDGGKGGNGQSGGNKGAGGASGSGASLKASCQGGDGGQGGLGGSGGGGQGGHSLGLAYTGTAPAIAPEQITIGPPGLGGPGGLNNTTPDAGKGADGIALPIQQFP